MNGAQESLKKAVAIVTQAITCDQEEKYEEAFTLYQRALEYFMHGLKCEFSFVVVCWCLVLLLLLRLLPSSSVVFFVFFVFFFRRTVLLYR
jgi:hypothetical protein